MLPRFLALLLLCAAGAATTGPASGAPAPWWLWESVHGSTKVCSQTPLGPGWRKLLGPYRDARCEKLIRAQ